MIPTCDNGIAAVLQIKLAKELGLTVLVTDHHDIGHAEERGYSAACRCGGESKEERLFLSLSGDLRGAGGLQAGSGSL